MSRAHFSQVRNTMHTYSRAPIAEGQEFIDQAVARSGHYVNYNEIRADEFPMISSIQERDEYFLMTNPSGIRVVGGSYGSKFTKVIQFLDKVSIQEIPLTNGESYRIVDANGNLVDTVYETTNGRQRFTSVLVGLPSAQYKTAFAFRGYAVLTKDNQDVIIYGPIMYRSIYQLAEQALSMNLYAEGSAAKIFLQKLIADGDNPTMGSVSSGDAN